MTTRTASHVFVALRSIGAGDFKMRSTAKGAIHGRLHRATAAARDRRAGSRGALRIISGAGMDVVRTALPVSFAARIEPRGFLRGVAGFARQHSCTTVIPVW